MAVSLEQRMKQFRALIKGFPEFHTNVGKTLAATAISEVNTRIVETGTDAKGKKLVHARSGKEYSETEIPTDVFLDADPPLPTAAAKRMPIAIAYVDYKQAVGRYRGKRDMMLTGRMWANTGLTENSATRDRFKARVAGRNQETQAKLDNNSALSKVDLLELSKEEEEILREDYDAELQIYIDDTVNG